MGRHVLTVEGNIGVGKSTTLAGLKARFADDSRVAFVDEDVVGWDRYGLLAGLYDGTLHKGLFQACALMPQIANLHRALQDPNVELVVTERSPWSNFHIFAEANLDATHLNAYEYVFMGMVELLKPFDLRVHMVFLDVPPETAMERLLSRARASEKTVAAEYIRLLDVHHRKFMEEVSEVEGATFCACHTVPPASEQDVVDAIAGLATPLLTTKH